MGFKDFLRKATELTKKAADKMAKEIKWHNRVKEAKREILSRFTVRQLEKIAHLKGISLYKVDPLTGDRERLRSKGQIISRLSNHLSFREIVDLARRYKVKYSDVVKELERFKQELFKENTVHPKSMVNEMSNEDSDDLEMYEEDVYEIVRAIQEKFMPFGIPQNEDDLKNQLGQWLAGRFENRNIVLEYPFEEGRVDIVIDEDIAIEVKVAWSRQSLKNLVGEVEADKLYFGKVIAVIFDVGHNIKLETYLNMLKSHGVIPIVIPAQVKRKGRKQEIIVMKGKQRIIIR